MLVLSRKAKEMVRIGDDIFITVVEIRQSVVRLGIVAPPEIQILRGELSPDTFPREGDSDSNRK